MNSRKSDNCMYSNLTTEDQEGSLLISNVPAQHVRVNLSINLNFLKREAKCLPWLTLGQCIMHFALSHHNND